MSEAQSINELGGLVEPLAEGEHVLLGAWLREVRSRARAEGRAAASRGDQRVAAAMEAVDGGVARVAAECEDSYARQHPWDWKAYAYGDEATEGEF